MADIYWEFPAVMTSRNSLWLGCLAFPALKKVHRLKCQKAEAATGTVLLIRLCVREQECKNITEIDIFTGTAYNKTVFAVQGR